LDILNETTKPGALTYSIPYPGIYIVDSQGKVLSKYFEDDYKEHADPFRRYEVGRTKWLEPYSYCPVARFVGRPGRKGRACSRPCDPAQENKEFDLARCFAPLAAAPAAVIVAQQRAKLLWSLIAADELGKRLEAETVSPRQNNTPAVNELGASLWPLFLCLGGLNLVAARAGEAAEALASEHVTVAFSHCQHLHKIRRIPQNNRVYQCLPRTPAIMSKSETHFGL
jgi:hypothetical protein